MLRLVSRSIRMMAPMSIEIQKMLLIELMFGSKHITITETAAPIIR